MTASDSRAWKGAEPLSAALFEQPISQEAGGSRPSMSYTQRRALRPRAAVVGNGLYADVYAEPKTIVSAQTWECP